MLLPKSHRNRELLATRGRQSQINSNPANRRTQAARLSACGTDCKGTSMRELSVDFAAHGKTAIIQCRVERPDVYVKIVASLIPRELTMVRPLDGLTDDELEACIALLRETW